MKLLPVALLRTMAWDAWSDALRCAFAFALASEDCDADGGARGAILYGR